MNNDFQANPIVDKSHAFALAIVPVCRGLQKRNEFVPSRQLLRSGTSIGANVEEAQAAQSKPDFATKMSTASKEARETRYWIKLLKDSKLIDGQRAASLMNDIDELIRILTAIVKSSRHH